MKAKFRSEHELSLLILSYLHKRDFIVFEEVPSLGKSVDIVARRGRQLYFFEVKLNDWRRAIGQAEPHLFVADFVLVVVPKKEFSQEFADLAKQKGIGIVIVDAETITSRFLVRPRQSTSIWLLQRRHFERHMEVLQNAY